MRKRTKTLLAAVVAGLLAIGVVAATGAAGPSISLTHVGSANAKTAGYSRPNILSPELQDIVWAQGSNPVENPSNGISYYGYDDGGTFLPLPSSFVAGPPASVVISQTAPVEATKTEPDKNTYLVLDDQKGADPNYDYGRHFLFQGHELGTPGYITRINLDADGPHRVTLMATTDTTPANLPNFDGSTWDPWAKRLLFTSEGAASLPVAGPPPVAAKPGGGVWQGTLDVPSQVNDLRAYLGTGGYEGIQNDDLGQLYIVEDVGGATNANKVKPANSYIYRFKPKDPSDLTKGGTIQALQVKGKNGQPITYADGFDVSNAQIDDPPKFAALHAYGSSFDTKWIDLVTTPKASGANIYGGIPYVNQMARDAGATPFKRPENGVFQPGSKFKKFYFTETGDTDKRSTALTTGRFGSLFALTQSPSSDNGSISVFYNGDLEHAGFDNLIFFGTTQLGVVEDRGDTLHGQQDYGLDSAWMFDTDADYSNPANKPVRFIAEGRDASATIDSALGGLSLPSSAFKNDGDNEITGIYVSDGDPGKDGILGAKKPKPFKDNGKWRAFWTQQHGDNNTFELIPTPSSRSRDIDHDH